MLYLQTCVIGFVILAIPLFGHPLEQSRDSRLFRAVIITVMLDFAFETGTWLLNGKVFPYSGFWIYLVNFFTILLQSVMGYLWLYYAMEKLEIRLPKKSLLHIACAAPLAVAALLLITNPWTHAVFYISPAHMFTRGSLFWYFVFTTFLYPAVATLLSILVGARTKNSTKKRNCRALAFTLVLPVVAAIVQLIFYGTFLFLIGLSLSLLIAYVSLQNERITVDFLTQTNNRASFISYFEHKIHNVRPGCRMYLFMIDVDFFKRVNDTYGHVVGDQVLIAVAAQLKRICASHKCFLARLGGDEFSILLECENEGEALYFAQSIRGAMDDFNSDSNLAMPVTLSVGYAACDETDSSVDRSILQADNMMYNEKMQNHRNEECKTPQASKMQRL